MMIKCDFCGQMTEDSMIFTLYHKDVTDKAITTEHIHICEMDFPVISKFDDEKEVSYVEYDGKRYYFREDL